MDTAVVDVDAAEHSAVAARTAAAAAATEGGTGGTAAGKKRKQGDDEGEDGGAATKTADGKMEGAGTTTIEVLPDELVLKVLTLLFGMTLMRPAPQVCKRWRKLCPEIKNCACVG